MVLDLEGLERQAAKLMPMPDNLTASEQLLFLSLRAIYREYRAGVINKGRAKREKAEAVRAYRDNAFREKLFQDAADRIKRSEAVRAEIEFHGCELCKRLTRILDGRD